MNIIISNVHILDGYNIVIGLFVIHFIISKVKPFNVFVGNLFIFLYTFLIDFLPGFLCD